MRQNAALYGNGLNQFKSDGNIIQRLKFGRNKGFKNKNHLRYSDKYSSFTSGQVRTAMAVYEAYHPVQKADSRIHFLRENLGGGKLRALSLR